jgi:hypothetical protein
MRFLLQRMRTADRLVVLGLLLAALAGSAWLATAPPGQRVLVSDGRRVLFAAPLDEARQVDLAGPLGTTRLVITADGARITASPCALKACMGMGPARRPGDLLACLPNRILVEIEGDREEGAPYDLLSR